MWMQVLDTTQCNIIKSLSFISDRRDLKWTNSTGTDIKQYLIFHIPSCPSRAQLENPGRHREKGQRVVPREFAGWHSMARGKLQPAVYVLCLGLLGKSQLKWRHSDSWDDLLHKACHEEDPGKAAPGRRREHELNFLAKSRWSQLANLVETLMLMFDVLSRALGTQSPNSKGLSVLFGCLKTLNYHDYPAQRTTWWCRVDHRVSHSQGRLFKM